MSAYFEAPPSLGLTGTIGVAVVDPDDATTTPNIIRRKNEFDVVVSWEIEGDNAPFLGGDWDLRLYCKNVDGVGTTNGQIDSKMIPLLTAPPAKTRKYTHTFKEAPGRITKGVYQFTVVLRYMNGAFRGPISGFAEAGVVEFTDA